MNNRVHDMTTDELTLFGSIVAKSRDLKEEGDQREHILDDVVRLLRSDATVSFLWDNTHSKYADPKFVNVSASKIKRFQEDFQFRDRWADIARRMPRPTPLDRVVSARDFERSEVYNEILVPDSLHRILALYLVDGKRQLGRLTVLRGRNRPAFEEREISLLSVLEPFIAKLFKPRQVETIKFTPREAEIAALIVRGCSDRDIARILGIAFYTVRTHVANLLAKTGCANRTELAAIIVKSRSV